MRGGRLLMPSWTCMMLGLFAVVAKVVLGQEDVSLPPEVWMPTPQLIKAAGFGVETHEVRTADGYLLTMYHMLPRANASIGSGHRTPFVVGNALEWCSEAWVIRQDSDNVVFQLMDQGFDAWLIDYRGSLYSRKHENLSSKAHEFWDFSWHENGVYDLPAAIDYVLAKTGQKSLYTMGHSMGSTVQLVLLSERPEYAKKVRAAFLLSPPAYFTEPLGVVGLLKVLPLRSAFSKYVINDYMPIPGRKPGTRYFAVCYRNKKVLSPLCRTAFEAFAGKAAQPVDLKLSWMFMSHYPCGSSIRQVMHFQQIVARGGEFRKYDYGAARNQKVYGEIVPPLYNLSKINVPMHMYYSNSDNLVNPIDAEKLAKDIPTVKRLFKVPSELFNHFDFLVGTTGIKELNEAIVEDFNKYI